MTMTFTTHHISCTNPTGTHQLAYSDWGAGNDKIIICVHGLTGNAHDFDELAPALVEDGYRVIAVDMIGRGRSDFMRDPTDYNFVQYESDLQALLDHLGNPKVDWLGVSMGGLLGMIFAGREDSPIQRLILNDVGPEVTQETLDFIHQMVMNEYTFDSPEDLEKRMRETRGLSWGPMSDAQWHYMAAHNTRQRDDGLYTYHYDPAIAEIFREEPIGAQSLWPYWEAITCPVQVLWGKQSLVFTQPIIDKMRENGPKFDLVTWDDCGHVPSLMAPYQIKEIQAWLQSNPI